MQKTKCLLVLIGVISISFPIFALDHSGTISWNETWYAVDNPHIIIGNITLNNGILVTIEPGCEVKFDLGKYINIYGWLSAAGTLGNEITFTGNGGVEWAGLRFHNNGNGNIEHCTIEDARYGTGYGVYASNSNPLTIENSVFQNNDNGLYSNVSHVLSNNTFQNNTTGIYYINCASPSVGTANTISTNTTGINFNSCSSPAIASGNIIEDNTNCGIYFQNCSLLGTYDSITLNDNIGYGAFRFENCGDFTLGSSNTFSNNSWPLTIDAGSFPASGSTIPASGNINNDIRITSGSGTHTGTWYLFSGLDYIVTESATLGAGVALTVADNTVLKFNSGTSISIYGTLIAQGTVGNGITFTKNGMVEWSGLHFQNNSSGTLEYCTVEYACYGSGYGIYANSMNSIAIDNCVLQYNDYGFYGNDIIPTLTNNIFQNTNTNIYISNTTSPVIGSGNSLSNGANGVRFNNCLSPVISAGNTIQDHTNYGVHYQNCSSLGTIDSITLNNNTGYGAFRFEDCGDFTLGSSNILSNNTWPLTIDAGCFPDPGSTIPTSGNINNDVRVTSGSGNHIGIWYPFTGLDYIITESPSIGAAGSLTIADDLILKFNIGISISIYGTLIAQGTIGNGITFTRNGTVEWSGLNFQNNSVGNLEYCTVEYVGYGSGYGIYASSPNSLTVNNCLLQYNDHGFRGNDVTPTLTNNIFENTDTNIHISNTNSPVIGSGNSISDGLNGVRFNTCISPVISAGNTIEDHANYGVYYQTCSSLGTIDSITLNNNTGYGAFRFENCGDFALGSSNIFSGNSWPLTIDAGCFPDPGSTIPISGNTNNAIRVTSGSGTNTGTWYPFAGLDYIATESPTLGAAGDLTVADNFVLKFNVGNSFGIYGTFKAPGTAGNGITFTRNDSIEWSGLQFQNNSTGTLEYCTVEYAGYGSGFGVYANSPNSLTVNYCHLLNNDFGFYGNNATPTLTNNNFQNTNTNIYFANTTSPVIGSGNSISDGLNGVRFNTCISPVISAGNTIEDHTNYGVYYQTCSSLGTIDSITLNNNDGYGAFKFENCGDFNLGSSNIFSGNSWPLTIDAGCFPDPGSTIPTSGNTNNDIRVTSGSGTNTGTWYPFTGLDYIVTETPTLGVAGSLTLAVNMLLKFNAGISFSIYGTMNAQGGEGNAITFTGNGAVEWSGLHFQSNSIGYLEFCTIENVSYGSGYGVYANSSNSLTVNYCHLLNNDFGFYGNNATPTLTNNNFQNTNTNIYFSNTTAPVIGSGNSISSGSNGVRFNTCISPVISAGNTIEDNTNCGVYYQTCSSLGTIDSMTLDNNEGYGAFRFENCGDFTLGHSNYLSNNSWPLTIDTGSFPAPSSYIPSSGNTNNDIRVTSGAGTNTGTWYPFAGLDYIITESPTLGAAGVLTIADGAELKFLFAKSFEIYGTLLAPGSTGIKFTRKDSVEWSGLKFYTGSTGNLEYCTIEYATYSNSYGIYAIAPTSLSLDNCVLQNNDFGFYGNNCDPDFSANNEFINNNNYGIYLTGNCTPTFGSNLTEWNDIYGNGTNDLRNGDNDIFAKYVYWGTILSTEIQAQIYDQNDDGALGLVDYIPYTDAAHHLEYAGDVTIPQNVSINITGDFVEISWDAVEGASSYKIYSSADPYAAIPWSFEYEVTVTNWSEPVDSKKFYYVTAVN